MKCISLFKKKKNFKRIGLPIIIILLVIIPYTVYAHLAGPQTGTPHVPYHNENPYHFNGFVAPYTGYFTVYVDTTFRQRYYLTVTNVSGGGGGGSQTITVTNYGGNVIRRIDFPLLMEAGQVYNITMRVQEEIGGYYDGEGWLPPHHVNLAASEVLCGLERWPWNGMFGVYRYPTVNKYGFYMAVRQLLIDAGPTINEGNVDSFIIKATSGATVLGDNSLGVQCWGDNPTYDGIWTGGYYDDVDFNDYTIMYTFRPEDVLSPIDVEVLIEGSSDPYTAPEYADYTVSWTSVDADDCNGTGGLTGYSGTSGSVLVEDMPFGTYTYGMECTNTAGAYGTDSNTATITYVPPPTVDVLINGLNANYYGTLGIDEDHTVSWTSTNADSCNGSADLISYSGISGSILREPSAIGIYQYTMTCQNAKGTASDSIFAYIFNIPTVDVRVNGENAITIEQPADYTATWVSTDTTYCVPSDNFTVPSPAAVSGSQDEYSMTEGTYTYTMTCYNGAGYPASDSAIATVVLPPPTVDIKINGDDGTVYHPGEPGEYDISWTSTNASFCSATTDPPLADWSGAVIANGTNHMSNVPYGTYTHYITCSNTSGSASDNVTIVIGQPLSGLIYSHYTGLVYYGPSILPPYGPLSCQRLYGTASGGVGPYMVSIYVDGEVYTHIATAGPYETSAEPVGNAPTVCIDTNFGTTHMGTWSAYAIIADAIGNVYRTADFGSGQGYEPVWEVGEFIIYDTP